MNNQNKVNISWALIKHTGIVYKIWSSEFKYIIYIYEFIEGVYKFRTINKKCEH